MVEINRQGLSLEDLFKNRAGESLSYEDFIILPGFTEDFSPAEVNLKTKLTKKITLNLPLVSSPMDTVTGELLARWLALLGGIGILHYNCSVEEQVKMVTGVKRFENGFILEPVTLSPNNLIFDITTLGYSTIPVTVDGKPQGKLVGMLTKVDFDPEEHKNLKVLERMIKINQGLVTATIKEISEGSHPDIRKANEIIRDKRLLALPIITAEGNLYALATRADIDKNRDFPLASKDFRKRLLVGAAIGTRDKDKERAKALIEAGVDVLVIDSAHAHVTFVADMLHFLKEKFFQTEVIAGNVATAEGVKFLAENGADAIKVGLGIGSICTTQEVTGVGRGQATAVWHCAQAANSLKEPVPIIADGGITQTGDLVKALVLGASTGMLGNLLAGTFESLGEWVEVEGLKTKEYRGMGSRKAMKVGSSKRYQLEKVRQESQAPEGIEARVLNRGHIYDLIPEIAAGLKQALFKIGKSNISDLHQAAKAGKIRVEQRTEAAKKEGRPHDLFEVISG